ncbi:unnamed protein product, partial [Urochloa humidicola]
GFFRFATKEIEEAIFDLQEIRWCSFRGFRTDWCFS